MVLGPRNSAVILKMQLMRDRFFEKGFSLHKARVMEWVVLFLLLTLHVLEPLVALREDFQETLYVWCQSKV